MDREVWHSGEIPTPVHARHDDRESVNRRRRLEQELRTPASNVPPSKNVRAIQWALLVTLLFVVFMVVFFYSSDVFVPVLLVGSLGVLVVIYLVIRDMLL